MSIITHRGPWDLHSGKFLILRFLEEYQRHIDSLSILSTPYSKFFSPDAIYHDTRGDVWISGSHIWRKLSKDFEPFDRLVHEVIELRGIEEEDGKFVVYGQYLTYFRLKGEKNEIIAPRFFVWTIGEAEEGMGTDGYQIFEESVFWDTGLLVRQMEENKKQDTRMGRELASRSWVGKGGGVELSTHASLKP